MNDINTKIPSLPVFLKLQNLAGHLNVNFAKYQDEALIIETCDQALIRLKRYELVIEKLKADLLTTIKLLAMAKNQDSILRDRPYLTHYFRDNFNELIIKMLEQTINEYTDINYLNSPNSNNWRDNEF